MVVASGWGKGGVRSYYLMGKGFQFYRTKRIMEIGGGDGRTTLLMYLPPPNCILADS